MLRLFVCFLFTLPLMVLAQEAAVPVEAVEPSLADKILAILASASGASATIAVVVEFALRLIPSPKPLSIMHMVSGFVRLVAQVAEAVADLLDKVLPQKIKE